MLKSKCNDKKYTKPAQIVLNLNNNKQERELKIDEKKNYFQIKFHILCIICSVTQLMIVFHAEMLSNKSQSISIFFLNVSVPHLEG